MVDFKKACGFFGHREVIGDSELYEELCRLVKELVEKKDIETFLFGSRSRFDSLCYNAVSCIKEQYQNIKRVYVRAEYPFITKEYEEYLLKDYEYTYYPDKMIGAGRAVYVERNIEIINNSEYCIFYYNPNRDIKQSGTKKAYDYALRKGVKTYNLYKGE